MIRVSVRRLHPSAQLPRYAHTGPWGDLAADLYAVEAVRLSPGQTLPIPTGIALELPSSYGALVEDRSGLAVRGLTTLAGVIDPGYRGELKVVLTNLSAKPKDITPGDRIAQLRLVQRIEATFEEADELIEAPRGANGFWQYGPVASRQARGGWIDYAHHYVDHERRDEMKQAKPTSTASRSELSWPELSELSWPELPWAAWEGTASTLHMWTQIVGKTRLALTPLQNHWWNVPLYVTAHGLSTSAMAYTGSVLEIEFDFVGHALHLRSSIAETISLPLRPQSVADFYREYLGALKTMGVEIALNPMPVEVADPIRFDLDTTHASYDPLYAHRFWVILTRIEQIFRQFNVDFLGKVSPIHFFWGSFDLAVTRFSGRLAPPRPGADGIQREAYSHEVISAGFWPGNGGYGAPALYCYAAPVPEGLADAKIQPSIAAFDAKLGEFLLPYDALRTHADPEAAVLEFLQTSYAAAADLAKWDRASLER